MNKTQIAGATMTTATAKKLKDFDLETLDTFERHAYRQYEHQGKAFALQLLINTVEGDFTQLSEGLADIAVEQFETEQEQ